MFPRYSGFAILAFFSFALLQVDAFSFTFNTPTECDDIGLSWTGGTGPFNLLITPLFGTPRNISIPDTAFSNGKGTYSLPLPLQATNQTVFTMSDGTGFNSGGTTQVLKVGASKGGSCNSKDPGIAFSYQLNLALQQCRPYTFTAYDGAVQPVVITALVPGGTFFTLNPPVGGTSFTWNANVARGTSLIFLMTDAQGRQGGASDVTLVSTSDDDTCLSGSLPSSTASPPQTPTSSSASDSPSSTSTEPASKGVSMGAIAGTIIGGLLFVAVLVTLGLFFLKKRRDGQGGNNRPRIRESRALDSDIDLTYDPSQAGAVTPYNIAPSTTASLYPSSPNTGRQADPSNPFLTPTQSRGYVPPSAIYSPSTRPQSSAYEPSMLYEQGGSHLSPPQGYSPYQSYSPQTPNYPNNYGTPELPGSQFDPYATPSWTDPSTARDSMTTANTGTTAARGKAAMAGNTSYKPARIVMHTDLEDELPEPDEDGVVELPPQYTERRGQLGVANPTLPRHQTGAPYPP